MALDSELLNLRSAGTYRFERDLSTISNDTTSYSNLRLVVGFSKIGPFNTPKLVTSASQFIKLYGNIDRSLEKKGSYFHRSALVALNTSPILCLNLLNLDPDKDQIQTQVFSVNTVSDNKKKITLPVTGVYNTDKFWYIDDESLLNGIDMYLGNGLTIDTETSYNYSDGILSFTNVGKKPISILVKKASDNSVKGYNLTLAEWYGEGDVPEYLNSTSYVSDYMVEVYVVQGDFGPSLTGTNVTSSVNLDDDNSDDGGSGNENLTYYTSSSNPYQRFQSDINYQDYFDENGFKRRDNDSQTMDSKLTKFLNLSSVNLLAKYVGSLIPNFVDKLGKNIWIVKQVNDDTDTIGLVCAENVNKIESVDLDADVINERVDLIGHNTYANIINHIDNISNNANDLGNLSFDFLSYKYTYNDVSQVIAIQFAEKSSDTKVGYIYDTRYYTRASSTLDDHDTEGCPYPFAWYRTYPDNDNHIDNTDILYTNTTYVTSNNVKVYADCSGTGSKTIKTDSGETTVSVTTDASGAYSWSIISFTEANKIWSEIVVSDDIFYTSKDGNADNIYVTKDNEVILSTDANIIAGDYLVSYYGNGYTTTTEDGDVVSSDTNSDNGDDFTPTVSGKYSRVTRVVETRKVYDSKGKFTGLRVICADKIYKAHGYDNNFIVKITPVDKIADRFQWTCLKGLSIRKDACPNGTNERQNEILDMLREEPLYDSTTSNLYKSLCDRDYIQWRYLVDTFGYGLEEECKSVYTLLCQGRKSALAIINCPSQADFKKSTDPSFINKVGSVDVEYISTGGDTSKNPTFLYSLPKLENGASWGAYYYPYLKISDLSAVKTVPPAAYVSNLYIQKYSNSQAWAIVAGQKRGVISGNQVVGVEATLIHENRDYLEPVGINSIIWENGVGVEVYANKTAKQSPKSALSSIHVREACIYIQDNVETILRKYVFEYNTAQSRLEIKTLVDDFLETVKNNNGVYDYKTIMDTTNNTSEVIDNNMGIIDIYIEPVRGMEILAQRLTVLKTGSIAAGSFE